jgi:GntR family transcriptional regulator
MPKFSEGNIPLYFQFYLAMKNNILLGDIKPGSRLPTINELNEEYGVSHATVRKALELLREEGLITKKRGVGTQVRESVDIQLLQPKITLQEAYDKFKDSNPPKVLSAKWDVPPRRISSLLDKQSGVYRQGKIYTEHVFRGSGQSFGRKAVLKNYIPANTIEKYGEKNFKGHYFIIIVRNHPEALAGGKAKTIIRPSICDAETARLLGIPDGTPVFFRSIIYYDHTGNIIYITEDTPTANNLVEISDKLE